MLDYGEIWKDESQRILLKRSNTPGFIPKPAQIITGELCINTYDGILFFKNNKEQIFKIKGELLSKEEQEQIENDLNINLNARKQSKIIKWCKSNFIVIKGLKNKIWKFKGEKV